MKGIKMCYNDNGILIPGILVKQSRFHRPVFFPAESCEWECKVITRKERKHLLDFKAYQHEKEYMLALADSADREDWEEMGAREGQDTMIAAFRDALNMTPEEFAKAGMSAEGGYNYSVVRVYVKPDGSFVRDECGNQWAVCEHICFDCKEEQLTCFDEERSAQVYAAALNLAQIPIKHHICKKCQAQLPF